MGNIEATCITFTASATSAFFATTTATSGATADGVVGVTRGRRCSSGEC